MSDGLIKLEAEIRADLAMIAHPGAAWLEPKTGPDGKPALDVLIIGAGQSGIAIGFGLMRSRVSNILLLDKAEEGKEGPWLTYARMPTLRSPKDYTGPDLDIPSLTYQSWHEARFGKESWQALNLILREHWAEYLLWLRRTLGLPVRNGCELLELAPASDGLLAARVKRADGIETLYARKIVLATGQEGMGDWMIPEPLRGLPKNSVATVADDIDFNNLRGKRVAVIGAGASAFDNAATALESGAAEVHLLCRRAQIQVIQPSLADLSRLPASSQRSRRCLALALHAYHPGNARRLSAADLRSLRASCQFYIARRRAARGGQADRQRC